MRIVGDGVMAVDPSLDEETVFDRESSRIRTCARRCHTCIIGGADSLAKSMHPGELKRFLDSARNSYVICHSTGPETATQAAVCRGWADTLGKDSATFQRLLALIGDIDVGLEGDQGDGGNQRSGGAGVDRGRGAGDGSGAGGVPGAAAVADAAQHGSEGSVRDGHADAGGDVGGRVRREVGLGELVSLGEFFREEKQMAARGSSTSGSSASGESKPAQTAATDERETAAATSAEQSATPKSGTSDTEASSSTTPQSGTDAGDGKADTDGDQVAPADQTSVEQSAVAPVGDVQGTDEDKQVPDPEQYETDEWKTTHGPNPLAENPGSDY
jgi:hypothetical protein